MTSWPWFTPADYAELEEQNERLTKELDEATARTERPLLRDDYTPEEIKSIFLHADYWEAQYDKSQAELAEATAQIGRLREAFLMSAAMPGLDPDDPEYLQGWYLQPGDLAPTPGPEDDDEP